MSPKNFGLIGPDVGGQKMLKGYAARNTDGVTSHATKIYVEGDTLFRSPFKVLICIQLSNKTANSVLEGVNFSWIIEL